MTGRSSGSTIFVGHGFVLLVTDRRWPSRQAVEARIRKHDGRAHAALLAPEGRPQVNPYDVAGLEEAVLSRHG